MGMRGKGRGGGAITRKKNKTLGLESSVLSELFTSFAENPLNSRLELFVTCRLSHEVGIVWIVPYQVV